MADTEALEPCPMVAVGWCKGGEIVVYDGDSRSPAFVKCSGCRTNRQGMDRNEAIAAWNRRALTTERSGEAVAWMYEIPGEGVREITKERWQFYTGAWAETPLYTHPFEPLRIDETDDHEALARFWHQQAMEARAALAEIRNQDEHEIALDPGWLRRIARAALKDCKP